MVKSYCVRPTRSYRVNVTGVPGHRCRGSDLAPSTLIPLESPIGGLQMGAMAKSAGLVSRDPIHASPGTPVFGSGCDAEHGLSGQSALIYVSLGWCRANLQAIPKNCRWNKSVWGEQMPKSGTEK